MPSIYLQHNTIEAVLERGEKLDDLVEKSEGLTMQSKAFYKTVSHFTKLLVPYQTVLNNSRNLSYFIAVPHDWTRNYSSKQFEGN